VNPTILRRSMIEAERRDEGPSAGGKTGKTQKLSAQLVRFLALQTRPRH
jgi:hypothetical protein